VCYSYYSENLKWAAQNLRLGRGWDIAGLTELRNVYFEVHYTLGSIFWHVRQKRRIWENTFRLPAKFVCSDSLKSETFQAFEMLCAQQKSAEVTPTRIKLFCLKEYPRRRHLTDHTPW